MQGDSWFEDKMQQINKLILSECGNSGSDDKTAKNKCIKGKAFGSGPAHKSPFASVFFCRMLYKIVHLISWVK